MKPIKSLLPLSTWLMRIGLLAFAYSHYFNTIIDFNYKSPNFYIALLFSIFSVLIFITGFVAKQSLSVVSGLVLSVISIYNLVILFDNRISEPLAIFVIITAISLFFLANPSSR